MSAICPNCKARLSCGCQRRASSDGTAVCSNCLASYEAKLKAAKTVQPVNPLHKKAESKITITNLSVT